VADLVISSSNVTPGTGANTLGGTAGEAIDAGEVCYLDSTTNKYKLADANDSSSTATVKGIAVNSAILDQPITVLQSGDINVGSVLTTAEVYVLSATPGKIAPVADLASGWYTSILGVAKDADTLTVSINNSGFATA